MNFIETVRYFFAKRNISQLGRREKNAKPFVFEQTKTVLLLYDADDKQEGRAVVELYSSLKNLGKQVDTLGYLNIQRKKSQLQPKLGYDYIYKDDFNFTYKLTNGVAGNLISKNHDLVIDLDMNDLTPLNLILVQCNAKLKAAPMRINTQNLADFMINVPTNQNIDTFATNLIHYLNNFNK